MAELNFTSGKRSRGGKPRAHKMQTRIDMTPMVDLGFLLITFFILTTTLVKLNTMQLTVPAKTGEQPVKDKDAVTILLDKNNTLYYYFGGRKDNADPIVYKSNYTPAGIRQMLLTRNADVNNQIRNLKYQYETGQLPEKEFLEAVKKAREMKTAPIVMIKAADEATYNNLVDILDELRICHVAKYALVDITDYDKDLIKKKNKSS